MKSLVFIVTSLQTYHKGAWTLHMLRNMLGDAVFRHGIQNYYRTYFNANATTANFRYQMEKASGKDLSAFFQQWLVQPGNLLLDPRTVLLAKWTFIKKQTV